MARTHYAIVTPPGEEALTTDEAKEHLKVTNAAQDARIDALIAASRRYLESQWGLAIMPQTWRAVVDEWPADGVRLRPYPVNALTAVKLWTGSAFEDQDLSGFTLVEGRPAFATLEAGAQVTTSRTRQGIEVHFTAGWADAAAVPENIKQASLLLIGHWFRNREASVSSKTGFGVSADLTRGVEDLMAAYRSPRLA